MLFLLRKNFVELELNDGVQPVEPLSFEQDARMSFQSEPLQVFQIRTNRICQKPPGRGDEIRTEPGRTMVDAPFRLSQLLTVQIEQETAVIVEDGAILCTCIVSLSYRTPKFPLWRSVFKMSASRMHIRRKAFPLPMLSKYRRKPEIVRSLVSTAAFARPYFSLVKSGHFEISSPW